MRARGGRGGKGGTRGEVEGRRRGVRNIITYEIRETVVDLVGMSTRKAGQVVCPNLSHYIVTTITQVLQK